MRTEPEAKQKKLLCEAVTGFPPPRRLHDEAWRSSNNWRSSEIPAQFPLATPVFALNLVKKSAIGEMRLLCLRPAAKCFVNCDKSEPAELVCVLLRGSL